MEETVETARKQVDRSPEDPEAYVELGKALHAAGRSEDAVTWFKRGLEKAPGNQELEAGLGAARLTVLEALLDESDEDEEPPPTATRKKSKPHLHHRTSSGVGPLFPSTEESEAYTLFPSKSTSSTDVQRIESKALATTQHTELSEFDEQVSKIFEHLDVLQLFRLGAVHLITEIARVRKVSLGLTLFSLGLFAHCVSHHQKLMILSMVLLCFYRSTLWVKAHKYVHAWAATAEDRFHLLKWIPRAFVAVPIVMKIVGEVKFTLFLLQDHSLTIVVSCCTGGLVAMAMQAEDTSARKRWANAKRLKVVAYAVTILYWAVLCGHWADCFRLVAPALMDSGSMVLGSLTSDEVREVCRQAWLDLYKDVCEGIQKDVDVDAWFFLGLSNWAIEYWQQPTTFSFSMLQAMLVEGFGNLEQMTGNVLRPELRQMRRKMQHLAQDSNFALLVEYIKQTANAVPPSKKVGTIGLAAKKCASMISCTITLLLFAKLPLPLLPFAALEVQDAQWVYRLHTEGELDKMDDGLDILLLGSPMVRVWLNIKAALYCLEASITVGKAVNTGANIARNAGRLGRLAAFAAKVRSQGFAPNAHEVPEHITNVFLASKDSNAIVEGVKSVVASPHLQDVARTVGSWWKGTKHHGPQSTS